MFASSYKHSHQTRHCSGAITRSEVTFSFNYATTKHWGYVNEFDITLLCNLVTL